MEKIWEVLSTIIISMGIFRLDLIAAENDSSGMIPLEIAWINKPPYTAENDSSGMIPLEIAWINKPPYTIPPTTDSYEIPSIMSFVMDDVVLECDNVTYYLFKNNTHETASEFQMVERMRLKKVQSAFPIFEPPSNRQYRDFHFLKIGRYPGSEYITTQDEINAFSTIVDEVLKSWPLLALTLVLTAIAGIIMWALDTYWNIEEFPRPFIKGSWDGFWWSFISFTTVGYGDKTPKSILARVFSIIWILFGVIIMAIIMADLTSTLTALTMKRADFSIAGLKVAVLNNGTEYQHAVDEKAIPKVYSKVNHTIQAVKSGEVDGMLLDHYVASYYRKMDNDIKSLFTVKKFEFERDVGLLLSKDTADIEKCLDYFDDIYEYGDIEEWLHHYIDTSEKPTTPATSLFDVSAPFVKWLLYRSLGVLGGLLLMGMVWDICTKRRKAKMVNNVELVSVHVEKLDETAIERGAKRSDAEVTRQLLREVKERFDKLEAIIFEEYDGPEPKELQDDH